MIQVIEFYTSYRGHHSIFRHDIFDDRTLSKTVWYSRVTSASMKRAQRVADRYMSMVASSEESNTHVRQVEQTERHHRRYIVRSNPKIVMPTTDEIPF